MFGSIGRLLARFNAQPLFNAVDRVFVDECPRPLEIPEAILYPYSVPDFSELLDKKLTDENCRSLLADILIRLKSTFLVERCQIAMPVAEIDRVSATKGYSGRIETIADFISYLSTTAAHMHAAGKTFTPIEWSTPADYRNNIDHLKRNTGIDYRIELYSGAYRIQSERGINPHRPIVTLSNDGGGHHGLAAFFQARNDRLDDTLPGNLRVTYIDPAHCQSLCDNYHVILVPTGPFFRILVDSQVNQVGTKNFKCVHQDAPDPWRDHKIAYFPKSDALASAMATALLDKGEPHGILNLGAELERLGTLQRCPIYLQKHLSPRFNICGIPALE